MGKHKKPKTQHLDDAEIWDDSALLRSWDEAVAEYEVSEIQRYCFQEDSDSVQYYHSIHARGEDVEEVLRQADLQEAANAHATPATNGKSVAVTKDASAVEGFEEGEIEDDAGDDSMASAVQGVGSKNEPLRSTEEPQAHGTAESTRDIASQPLPSGSSKFIL